MQEDEIATVFALTRLSDRSLGVESQENTHNQDDFDIKPFPAKLFSILEDESYSSIVTWLPNGESFFFVDKKRFEKEVLPKYFKHTKFTSFTRKLSRWNFQRVARGPLLGAYSHKLFLKGRPDLCSRICCKMTKLEVDLKSADATKKSSISGTPKPQVRVETHEKSGFAVPTGPAATFMNNCDDRIAALNQYRRQEQTVIANKILKLRILQNRYNIALLQKQQFLLLEAMQPTSSSVQIPCTIRTNNLNEALHLAQQNIFPRRDHSPNHQQNGNGPQRFSCIFGAFAA